MRLNNKIIENNLIEYNKNKAKESNNDMKDISDKIDLTTNSISDIQNNNMELNNRLNKVIEFGNNFVNDTKRKFENNIIKQDQKQNVRFDDDVFYNPDKYFTEINPIYDANNSFISTDINSLDEFRDVGETKEEPQQVKVKQINNNNFGDIVGELKEENKHEMKEEENKHEMKEEENKQEMKEEKTKPIYKHIKNETIRKLIKKLEKEANNRDLSQDEKILLQPFYKDNELKWSNRTKKTITVLNQLKTNLKK